jgi:plastocyanin
MHCVTGLSQRIAAMRHMIFVTSLFVAAPALAQAINWSTATPVTVALSSFAYAPSTVRVPAGVPVRLILSNESNGGHNFAAPEFFAAATVRQEDRASIRRGSVEVRRGSSVTITLVPRAGRYRLRCTHLLHTSFGMSGEIVVE